MHQLESHVLKNINLLTTLKQDIRRSEAGSDRPIARLGLIVVVLFHCDYRNL
jgi:hypothetical protein